MSAPGSSAASWQAAAPKRSPWVSAGVAEQCAVSLFSSAQFLAGQPSGPRGSRSRRRQRVSLRLLALKASSECLARRTGASPRNGRAYTAVGCLLAFG